MNIEKLTDIYYRMGTGIYDEANREKTKATILHLIDNGYADEDIINIMKNSLSGEYLKPGDLPDALWENSLLKRDTYYYHNSLHITSKPPRWNPETLKEEYEPFFMEMKIRFTIDDLLSYYYKTCNIDINLRDKKRDAGAFEYMLSRYHLCGIEGVDFLLMLIDEASKKDMFISNPLKMQDVEGELLDYLLRFLPEAEHSKANKITWRHDNV